MTTSTLTSVEEAAARLLDAVATGTDVELDVVFDVSHERELERLMDALHDEARRRKIGVTIEPKEGRRLCVSLHHP